MFAAGMWVADELPEERASAATNPGHQPDTNKWAPCQCSAPLLVSSRILTPARKAASMTAQNVLQLHLVLLSLLGMAPISFVPLVQNDLVLAGALESARECG
jgi:hypothetical protein